MLEMLNAATWLQWKSNRSVDREPGTLEVWGKRPTDLVSERSVFVQPHCRRMGARIGLDVVIFQTLGVFSLRIKQKSLDH